MLTTISPLQPRNTVFTYMCIVPKEKGKIEKKPNEWVKSIGWNILTVYENHSTLSPFSLTTVPLYNSLLWQFKIVLHNSTLWTDSSTKMFNSQIHIMLTENTYMHICGVTIVHFMCSVKTVNFVSFSRYNNYNNCWYASVNSECDSDQLVIRALI